MDRIPRLPPDSWPTWFFCWWHPRLSHCLLATSELRSSQPLSHFYVLASSLIWFLRFSWWRGSHEASIVVSSEGIDRIQMAWLPFLGWNHQKYSTLSHPGLVSCQSSWNWHSFVFCGPIFLGSQHPPLSNGWTCGHSRCLKVLFSMDLGKMTPLRICLRLAKFFSRCRGMILSLKWATASSGSRSESCRTSYSNWACDYSCHQSSLLQVWDFSWIYLY